MAFRHDSWRIDSVERTPGSAGLRIPTVLTRPGVFVYEDEAGKKIREYRPPAEVAKADSLASYEDAHVAIGHPPGGVLPGTYQAQNVGHVRAGSIKTDAGGRVVGSLFVGRADAIQKIDKRELHDVSCGYSVRIDETPGVTPEGEAYDRVQRDIVVNHVALLPRGDGRLGTECAMRLDGAGEQIRQDCPCDPVAPAPRADEHLPWDTCMAKAMKEYGDKDQAAKVCGSIKAKYGDSMQTIVKFDGKDYTVRAANLAEDLAPVLAAAEAHKTRADAVQGRIDASEAAATKARLDGKAEKVKALDAAFVYDAAKHSEAYLDGRIDAAPVVAAPLNPNLVLTAPVVTARVDSNDPLEAAATAFKNAANLVRGKARK